MRQFENPANPRVHYETTGPEIWEQLEGKVDGIAIGVGTGGTFSGIARFLKEKNPAVRCWGVEPPDSVYGGGDGQGEHMVEGIGNSWSSRPRSTARSPTGSSRFRTSRASPWWTALGRMGLTAARLLGRERRRGEAPRDGCSARGRRS